MRFEYTLIDPKLLKSDWATLEKEIAGLSKAAFESVADAKQFVNWVNELEVLIEEIEAWHYIKCMQDSKDIQVASLKQQFQQSVASVFRKNKTLAYQRLLKSPQFAALVEQEPSYRILQKQIAHEQALPAEDVSAIDAKITAQVDAFNALQAQCKVSIDGETMPAIIARVTKLTSGDREQRRQVYNKIAQAYDAYTEDFERIYEILIELRTQKAQQLGFANFRDWKWQDRNFQYKPADTADLCNAIKEEFMPVQKEINLWRQEALGLSQLMPWDTAADVFPKSDSNHYENSEDLKDKVQDVCSQLHPEFGLFFERLRKCNHVDIEAGENKSPSMFTSYLPESGVPFIYMLMAKNMRGISTLIHESAHAIHSLYNVEKKLLWLKEPDTEAEELFAISMEYLALEHWDVFIENKEELLAAKMKKIEDSLKLFKMVGLVDSFQTWVYVNPKHTRTERDAFWAKLLKEFDVGVGQTAEELKSWQRFSLLYRAPFYMIEYAIATLGALAIYKESKKDQQAAIERMRQAMKLGNTVELQKIYETAGVKFDFSRAKVREIASFIRDEWQALKSQIELQDA